MTERPDNNLLALRELPALDMSEQSSVQLRRAALAMYRGKHAQHAGSSRLVWAWSHLMVPALLGSTAVIYLVWALRTASAVYR